MKFVRLNITDPGTADMIYNLFYSAYLRLVTTDLPYGVKHNIFFTNIWSSLSYLDDKSINTPFPAYYDNQLFYKHFTEYCAYILGLMSNARSDLDIPSVLFFFIKFMSMSPEYVKKIIEYAALNVPIQYFEYYCSTILNLDKEFPNIEYMQFRV